MEIIVKKEYEHNSITDTKPIIHTCTIIATGTCADIEYFYKKSREFINNLNNGEIKHD